MGLPTDRDARAFYRAAEQRFGDAVFLREGGRTRGAIYLAGYAVECMLKALLLESLPLRSRAALRTEFRGRVAHDYGWLRQRLVAGTGRQVPRHIAVQLRLVNSWTPDMRYQTSLPKPREIEAFMAAAESILRWAKRSI